jgi:hypothetical protein
MSMHSRRPLRNSQRCAIWRYGFAACSVVARWRNWTAGCATHAGRAFMVCSVLPEHCGMTSTPYAMLCWKRRAMGRPRARQTGSRRSSGPCTAVRVLACSAPDCCRHTTKACTENQPDPCKRQRSVRQCCAMPFRRSWIANRHPRLNQSGKVAGSALTLIPAMRRQRAV